MHPRKRTTRCRAGCKEVGCHACRLRNEYRLSEMQLNVLSLIVLGCQNSHVEAILGLPNLGSAKNYYRNISCKLGVYGRLKIWQWMRGQGFIG